MFETDLGASWMRWNALLEKLLFSHPHSETLPDTNCPSKRYSTFGFGDGD
jgi:hypothetical protein